jgi:hypothetical protein
MSTTAGIEAFFAEVNEGTDLYDAVPDGVAICFDLRGSGGGLWTVDRRGGYPRIRRKAVPRPDCRLQCTVDDFHDLLGGRLSTTRAFMEGRLEVQGDVGLILRLHQIFGRGED